MTKKIILISLAFCLLFGANAQSSKTKGKVRYKIYLNYQGHVVPDFSTFGAPDITGSTDIFNFEGLEFEKLDHCAGILEYDLKIKADDLYSFRISSDDGSNLYIDGEKLIDNDGEHGPVRKEADIKLNKGTHLVRVEYFEYHKSQSLFLDYKSSSGEYVPVGDYPDDTTRPSFVLSQAKETAKRVKAWKGDDEVILFPILTDVHTCSRNTVKHVGYIAEMDKYFNYDFMVNLGDIGLNAERAHNSQSYANTIINDTRNEMAKFKGVFLFAPGNHDFDGGEGRHITSGELSELFQKPSLPYANGNLHLTEGKCRSYYDMPEKKMRFIILNSQSTETIGTYYTYGMEQMGWLINLLNATPEDYSVMVFCHYMPHNIGRWPGYKTTTEASSIVLMSILSDYANKMSGKESDLSWDFSKANGRLIGLFSGDSHLNAHAQENGVNYFITQGYGLVEQEVMNPGAKHAWYNSRQSLCCDLIAIKPATREIHTFRIGAGGADMDFQFNY